VVLPNSQLVGLVCHTYIADSTRYVMHGDTHADHATGVTSRRIFVEKTVESDHNSKCIVKARLLPVEGT
jgi:hypothetical protein